MSRFIIKHPNTPLTSVHNKPLAAGYMNEIERQTMHKLININSCIREEQAPAVWSVNSKKTCDVCHTTKPCQICDKCCYSQKWKSSNFIVRLPETLDKVVSMKLSAAEIPNTIYSISHTTQTNVFQLIQCDKSRVPVELPSGNYDAEQLVFLINNILTQMYINKCITCRMCAGYDPISGRFYFYMLPFTVGLGACCCGLDFRLPNDCRDIKMNLGWMLGFRKALYCCENYIEKEEVWAPVSSMVLTPPKPRLCVCGNKKEITKIKNKDVVWPCRDYISCTDGSNVTMKSIAKGLWGTVPAYWPHGYIAEGILNIAGPKYLFLVINDFNNNVHNKYTSLVMSGVSFQASNVLARISMPYGKNEIGYDDTSDLIPKIREYFGPVRIEKLHIQLVDELGRIVDLNNNDISLLLDFQCLYNL
jgi:hypothetical protein